MAKIKNSDELITANKELNFQTEEKMNFDYFTRPNKAREVLNKCNGASMNDDIAKPVDERLFYSKIVRLVKKPLIIVDSEKNEKTTCINLNYLMQRTKSNPDLMMEMIGLYLEQTPELVKTIKQSSQNKDWDLLQSSVHKMIPSFSIMGISSDFENTAKKIHEYAINQQQTDNIHDLVLQLESICEQACNELKDEFNKIKNTK